MSTMTALAARYLTYLDTPILAEIGACDDMFQPGGSRAAYMHVGRSAVDVLVAALLTAGRAELGTILDLPSGGGRVARHLRALFPESELYVSDLATEKQAWVVEHIPGALPFDPPDFSKLPGRTFDLIWGGSLLTHFNLDRFTEAVTWFIRALSPDGLLILTTHGRRYEAHLLPDEVRASRDRVGFGFVATDSPTYGLSLTAPSWVIRLVESEPTLRIIGDHEAAWNDHQDALVVQRRPVAAL